MPECLKAAKDSYSKVSTFTAYPWRTFRCTDASRLSDHDQLFLELLSHQKKANGSKNTIYKRASLVTSYPLVHMCFTCWKWCELIKHYFMSRVSAPM